MIEGFYYKRKKILKKRLHRLESNPIYTVIRDAYEGDDIRRIRETLFELLWTFSKDKATKTVVNSFINCIKKRDSKNPDFESVYKDFVEYIDSISCELYSFEQWYKLRAACNVVSLFEAGHVCRNKSKQAVLLCRAENEWILKQKFHVYLEDKKYTEAYELMKRINSPQIEEIYNFYTGINPNMDYFNNEEFDSFLSENRILIAGPAPLAEEDSNIDFKDYKIVKINYMGKEDRYGKPDISFYGDLIKIEMEKDIANSIEIINKVSYIIFKNSVPDWWSGSKDEVSPLDANDLMFMNASANAIPCIVFYLCRKTELKPLVIGTNLYAGKLYSDDYATGISYQKKCGYSLPRSSAKHDPTAQFLFMKRAYEAGLFETTSELKEILSLTEEEYIKRYQANILQQGC